MLLDELQQAWQSQEAPKLRIEPDFLLKEMVRNQQSLKRTLLWRDFREVFVGLALVPVSWWMARSIDWSALSIGAAGAWIAGYILFDRWRWRRGPVPTEQSLAACVDESLREVEHQIWLLKNIAWWYLLPCLLACLVVTVGTAVGMRGTWWERGGMLAFFAAFFVAVYYFIYWVNQYTVRTQLEPRRQELLAVRESLRESQE
ncbi:MAG: hypothetical protein WD468_07690 [Pirellulales bacterium]